MGTERLSLMNNDHGQTRSFARGCLKRIINGSKRKVRECYTKSGTGLAAVFLVLGLLLSVTTAQASPLAESEVKEKWRTFQSKADSLKPKGEYPFFDCFKKAAKKYDLPLVYVLSVARGESDFDPNAVSTSKPPCLGVMQIQWPGTAKDMGVHSRKDLFDPCININAGARYLRWLLNRYKGDYYLATAAYFSGPGNIKNNRVPGYGVEYADYIHGHLYYVTHQTNVPSSRRILLLSFYKYDNAVQFADMIQKRLDHFPIHIFKSNHYTYDIWAPFRTEKQRKILIKRYKDEFGLHPEKTNGAYIYKKNK